MSSLGGGPPSLTHGTCHRLLTNTLDKRSLPHVQILAIIEKTQPTGRSRHPPLFTVWISDGAQNIPMVAGLDVIWQIQTQRIKTFDQVRIIGYQTWFPPGVSRDNKSQISMLLWNVARVCAHPAKIGQPVQQRHINFIRNNAYAELRGDPKTYEWVPPIHQHLVTQGPPLPCGADANIPIPPDNPNAAQVAPHLLNALPMGGWDFAVGEPLPAWAHHMIPPGWTPLDADGLVQQGLHSCLDVPGWGYRWGADPLSILARQGAHPDNAAMNPAHPVPQGAPLFPPVVWPPGFVPPNENHPAHPGWDLLSTLAPGDTCSVWVRVTRIDNKDSTIDLVVHDQNTKMDVVVRLELKAEVLRLREGRCYQLFNVPVVASAKWCRTFHPGQLSLDKRCKIYEMEDPRIPALIIRPRRLNQLERGYANKSIDVWCVIMNTSAIIPGKPKGQATKGWSQPPNLTRCECWVTDKSLTACRLMAWDEFPEQLFGRDGEVVMLHNILMDDTRRDDICLKTHSGLTEIWRGQDAPQLVNAYNDMINWWNTVLTSDIEWNVLALSCSAEGSKALKKWGVGTRAPVLTIAQVDQQRLGRDQAPSHFKIEGTMQVINPGSVTYIGCANAHCNKKVERGDEIQPGVFRCSRCDHKFLQGSARYKLRFHIIDHNGNTHEAVAFDTATKGALKVSASVMRQRMDLTLNDYEQYNLARWAIDEMQTKVWLFTVEARTEKHGPWKGRSQWIVTVILQK
ncbi:hypothetical protein CALCODRAFT_484818 [Calocera cornea HHB12733]|uniref:Replication factor A C-terminal domain-containing protein n=1 Tax=Calocera cornea HHB12733 TaxID=1353952 RepID=A0A165EQS0_9BASI|nr:hypothetical protein CALCODRAFT_484818 [Calocera cornea HHB12733]